MERDPVDNHTLKIVLRPRLLISPGSAAPPSFLVKLALKYSLSFSGSVVELSPSISSLLGANIAFPALTTSSEKSSIQGMGSE